MCVFRSCFQLPGRPGHQGDGRWHPHAICQNPGGQQPAADQRHHLLCQKDPQRLTHTHTHKHARILFVLFTQTLKSFEPCVNTAKRVLLKRSRLMFPTRCWRNKRTAVYLHPERWTHRVRSSRRQYWLSSVCDFGCSFHSLLFKIKVALSCRLFCVSKDVW